MKLNLIFFFEASPTMNTLSRTGMHFDDLGPDGCSQNFVRVTSKEDLPLLINRITFIH